MAADPQTKPNRPSKAETVKVVRAYFDAVAARDVDAMAACWAPGGDENIHGQAYVKAPDGLREYFTGLFAAFPDFSFDVLSQTTEADRSAVQWRATGTFCGAPFDGMEPTGDRVELLGVDLLTVRDGRIVRNEAFSDGLGFARQLGMLPSLGSPTEERMTRAFNARTRVARRLSASAPEQVADGVWVVRGGVPRTMNVYLVRDGDGVLCFDGGVRSMSRGVAAAGARLGGITRVVLGHSHPDHRGVAAGLGVPVVCHPDERADAEGDGGRRYFDFSQLGVPARWTMPRMLELWDGGPVQVSATVEEGDDIAGFQVVHLPGHAPGQIGLWREADRLALSSDCFYTLNPETGIKSAPRAPHRAFNADDGEARASMRKLAALEPAAAWPGHADPLTGDVRGQLERAAAG